MTHIEVYICNGVTYGFCMEGHAGYNTKGPDILCASLSSVSQMTTNGIMDWLGEDIVKVYESGLFKVEIDACTASDEVIRQLFRTFELFIKELETMYPDNVKVEYKEDNVND